MDAFSTLASSGQSSPASVPDTPPPAAARKASVAARPPAEAQARNAPPAHATAPQPTRNVAQPEQGGRTCRACGGSNGAGARFCQLCGSPLEGAAADRKNAHSPQALHAAAALGQGTRPNAELVVIAQDGSPGRRYAIDQVQTTIGREGTDISLHKDPYVSPLHAEISYRNGRFYLSDRNSLNGVFVRLGGSVPLTSGDLLLVGLGVLRFEVVEETERNLAPQTRDGTRVFGTPPAPRYARLTVQTVEGVARDRYYLSRAETILGREVGDIVFTDDPFMSRRHAAIRRDPNTNRFSIRDLGSSNGTFIALRQEHSLSPGDHVRIGQHLFRLDVISNG
ncbi:MAG TPA: FHA domain-containing protein, partial [Polyangiaceae bacterium]|nr:FHA domain-containing protein [Polyangiaceae bacterium]